MDEVYLAKQSLKRGLLALLIAGLTACSGQPLQPDTPPAAPQSDNSSSTAPNQIATPAANPPLVPAVVVSNNLAPADHYLVTTTTDLWERLGDSFGLEQGKPAFPSDEASAEPQLPKNLWDRIRAGFALPYRHHSKVRPHLEEFIEHDDYLETVIERAKPYLFHVVEEVEKRGMPTEIVLVPIIESAYQASADSFMGASGLWQLIPSTGKILGLKKNFWYDGRRDVIASTRAALSYLQKLNGYFEGDWLLTLAAYNSGEGTVLRAIKKNREAKKPTDFWSLDLPRETEAYVPRLLGIASLIAQAEDLGVHLGYIPDTPYLASVELEDQLDLKKAAEMADITHQEIKLLNPGFTNGRTDPKGDFPLLLPVDKVEVFNEKLAEMAFDKRLRENSKKAAQRTKSDAEQNGKNTKSKLALNSAGVPGADTLPHPNAQAIIYTVRAGDSLSRIAQRFKISVTQLHAWNAAQLASNKHLQPGDNLKVYVNPELQAENTETAISQ